MEEIFFTLQDFMAYTKGVTYILMLIALAGIFFFWRFLTARDSE